MTNSKPLDILPVFLPVHILLVACIREVSSLLASAYDTVKGCIYQGGLEPLASAFDTVMGCEYQ